MPVSRASQAQSPWLGSAASLPALPVFRLFPAVASGVGSRPLHALPLVPRWHWGAREGPSVPRHREHPSRLCLWVTLPALLPGRPTWGPVEGSARVQGARDVSHPCGVSVFLSSRCPLLLAVLVGPWWPPSPCGFDLHFPGGQDVKRPWVAGPLGDPVCETTAESLSPPGTFSLCLCLSHLSWGSPETPNLLCTFNFIFKETGLCD